MQLKSFRVTNFRSIKDSGDIDVSRITALLGRNESGKSNLLRGLHSLNPLEGFSALDPIKNFPRDRRLEECNDHTQVVTATWELDDNEKGELLEILPRATRVSKVVIGRWYKGENRWVRFPGLGAIAFDAAATKSKAKKVAAAIRAKGAEGNSLEAAADAFEAKATATADGDSWAAEFVAAAKAARKALAAADVELSDTQDGHLTELEELAESITQDDEAQKKARNWAVKAMPKFFYLDDYPELDGHQEVSAYLHRKSHNQLTDADRNFEKLCKVAGLKPEKLQELQQKGDAEQRNQLANRASAVVTGEVKRLWKDRELKIRFNLDGNHFDTLISDPTATYDVEVNLNDRSRGFQWFFAFYVTFAADTDGGKVENAILLLDEPGLYLHAKSQGDLLKHFEDDFDNQILYSTHSPFMVPTHRLDSVRTVNIADKVGTTVTNNPTGDAKTLFPLQAALGYDLSQSLFVGPNNLVVEGVTDFWILSAISSYLSDIGKTALSPDLTLTPAGGAQKVSYMVALLTSESLNVLVLLDLEKESEATKNDLLKTKLVREQNVVFVAEAFDPAPSEADIEDLLDPGVFEGLVREAYRAELKGKTLKLNPSIPRIAKRVELAFEELGIPFHKTRPARLFLKKMASEPDKVLPVDSVAKFDALFTIINGRLGKHIAKGGAPFGG
ncbi:MULTISPECIES: AAA family ATPase [Stenotrophomonas]|uniref:AAA family ATPase n=1 Tax=Stenotrophomonas TaxID=40323 RepID=UPI001CF21CCC|nr:MULTISPECIES: AAA family ATPase [Stenotrophomonas]MCA7024381.1 ATP-binding protein [Stenotrophomonas acidaminiphila]MCE4076253.1 ATP-binding protein [Stenotrophomonas acidaminiphila]